ncbi:barstar family protein [Streptomyces yerevanensis]|uniref:barstar family protein n=1 Tax=Streptomyces yerevanensis TaxID=66378 RepID=UPI000525EB83|nr:barstar family protein [Streptomyces yerevanensis]
MTDDVADRLVVTLDLAGVADKAGFMERCVRALELPDWFGRNWDALADSLTDRSVWPTGAAERGLLIVVTGWRTYAKARPEEWEIAEDVFAEAADRLTGLSVLLVLGGSHQRPSDQPG